MLKDIKETPKALKALLNAYIVKEDCINLPIDPVDIDKIFIIASGSSRNAAITAKYFIEKIAKMPVIVEYAGEFANSSPVVGTKDLIIPLSQSGETADVIAALKKAKEEGACSFAITNNPGSTINQLSDGDMFVHAGQEESIPATKSFTCQLVSLYILGLFLAGKRNTFSISENQTIKGKLLVLPGLLSSKIIEYSQSLTELANKLGQYDKLVILGRGQNSALAEECALKFQETSYINAVGWATGEFMHGHLAVLDENYPVISLLTKTYNDCQHYSLAVKNTQKIKEKRNPFLVAIGYEEIGDADIFIMIDKQDEVVTPFLTTLAIQILAYKIADSLGKDTKKPRDLNKTVLSE